MYPQDGVKVLNLRLFEIFRTFAFFFMAATGGFVVWLLFQLVYDDNPPNVPETWILMALVALTIGAVYLALTAIKPIDLYQQYDQKAEYEGHLYKLLEDLEANTTIPEATKHELFQQYLLRLRGTSGHVHLANLPSQALSNHLVGTIQKMSLEEGVRIVEHIKANEGSPVSFHMKTSSAYCEKLMAMATALQQAPQA